MAQRGDLARRDLLALEVRRSGQLPGHLDAVLGGLLLEEPDVQALLGGVGLRVAFGEVGRIQVVRIGLAHGQARAYQAIEEQAERADAAVDVAHAKGRRTGPAVAALLEAARLQRPSLVGVALPVDRPLLQVAVEAQHLAAEPGAIQVEQAHQRPRLEGLVIGCDGHAYLTD